MDETDVNINNQIETADATKYSRYAASIISYINGAEARAATIKLVPHRIMGLQQIK